MLEIDTVVEDHHLDAFAFGCLPGLTGIDADTGVVIGHNLVCLGRGVAERCLAQARPLGHLITRCLGQGSVGGSRLIAAASSRRVGELPAVVVLGQIEVNAVQL